MSAGIRRKTSAETRNAETNRLLHEIYIENLKVGDTTSEGGFTSAIGSGSQSSGDYIHRGGDILLGRLGLQHEIVTISDGTINLSKNTGALSPFIIMNPEDGACRRTAHYHSRHKHIPANRSVHLHCNKQHNIQGHIWCHWKHTDSVGGRSDSSAKYNFKITVHCQIIQLGNPDIQ